MKSNKYFVYISLSSSKHGKYFRQKL